MIEPQAKSGDPVGEIAPPTEAELNPTNPIPFMTSSSDLP